MFFKRKNDSINRYLLIERASSFFLSRAPTPLHPALGANIKKEGFTTLHAIIGQNPDVVRLFLQLGIDVKCRCEHNGTPLQYALKVIKQNCEEIVDVLLNYGADVNLADEEKATPLYLIFLDCNTTKRDTNELD